MNLYSIKTYFLNSTKPAYKNRQESMENMLSNLKFTNYERFAFDYEGPKYIGNTLGHISLTQHAIEKQAFPFLILEDDVMPAFNFKDQINIPENIDLIYLGCSLFQNAYNKNKLLIQDYNADYFKLVGCFTTHALIIPDKNKALKYIEIISKAIDKKIPLDVELCNQSENYNFITPKDGPYFYQPQYANVTKFLWKDNTKYYYSEQTS